MDSILTSVKQKLGIAAEYHHFDDDIIMDINSVFSILTQIGVGPSSGFSITDDTAVWTDFIPSDNRMSMVKSYVCLKVRSMFDPPQSSAHSEAIDQHVRELESRMHYIVDPGDDE